MHERNWKSLYAEPHFIFTGIAYIRFAYKMNAVRSKPITECKIERNICGKYNNMCIKKSR